MKIGNNTTNYNVNANNMNNGIGKPKEDNRLKSIQTQIKNVQNQINGLSEKKDMSIEQKMEKRKELEQQLQDLNKEAAQRQMEIQKEKREKAAEEAKAKKQMEEPKDTYERSEASLALSSVQGIISAETSMSQAEKLQSVKTKLEGQKNVTNTEVKLSKGANTIAKKKESISSLEGKIEKATSGMMEKVNDVNKTLEEAKTESIEESKEEENKVNSAKEEDIKDKQLVQADGEEAGKQVKEKHIDIKL